MNEEIITLPTLQYELAHKLYSVGMYHDPEDELPPSIAYAENWVERFYDVNIHDFYNVDDKKWGCSVYKMQLDEIEMKESIFAPGLLNNPNDLRGYADKWGAISAAINFVLDYYNLQDAVDIIIKNNPDKVKEYLDGNSALFGFFVGELVKYKNGNVDPKTAISTIKKNLSILNT